MPVDVQMSRNRIMPGRAALSRSAAWAIFAAMIVGHAAAAGAQPAVAVSSRVDVTSSLTRLSVDLTAPVPARAFVLSDPDRVVIDLPEVNFQIDASAGRAGQLTAPAKPLPAAAPSLGKGRQGRGHNAAVAANPVGLSLIRAYRFGMLGPGRSRIVIDLTGPARIIRALAEPIAQGSPARLVVELASTDRDAFVAEAALAAKLQAQPQASEPPAPLAAASGRPVIVIDPGHGGIDAGASGLSGSVEKILVYDFSLALAAKLEAAGAYEVILTRKGDIFVSLGDRVKIARDRQAALFVSIHADTLSESAKVQGATIYTVSENASDQEAGRIAEKENQADSAAGVDGREEASGVSDILFDLTRRETRAYSHLFARTLVGVWQAAGRLNKNPQRSAGFKVLKAPDVPSVLIELGYLSSEQDVAALNSAEWRDKASSTIAQSIGQFFLGRVASLPGGGAAPVASGQVHAGAAVAPALH